MTCILCVYIHPCFHIIILTYTFTSLCISAAAVAPPTSTPTLSHYPPVDTPSPAAPVTPLTEDRTVPVKGFKAVMVRTMTASGKSNNRSRAPISEGFNFF